MRLILCCIAVVSFSATALVAKQKPGRGHSRDEQAFDSEKPGRGRGHDPVPASRYFRPTDTGMIRDYYRAQPGGLPPGLAKRGGNLPPGLEKQIRRNGTLPPGLQKRFEPLPPELEYRLPPCPEGFRRGFVGGVAVMWNPHSGLILDAVAIFRH